VGILGAFTLVFVRAGSATPILERELGTGRKILAITTFVLGILAFTPVPIQIVS
jgi:hypothetical protein